MRFGIDSFAFPDNDWLLSYYCVLVAEHPANTAVAGQMAENLEAYEKAAAEACSKLPSA